MDKSKGLDIINLYLLNNKLTGNASDYLDKGKITNESIGRLCDKYNKDLYDVYSEISYYRYLFEDKPYIIDLIKEIKVMDKRYIKITKDGIIENDLAKYSKYDHDFNLITGVSYMDKYNKLLDIMPNNTKNNNVCFLNATGIEDDEEFNKKVFRNNRVTIILFKED